MHKIIRALALTLLFTALSTGMCFADITGENGKTIPSVVTSIPATHEIKGDKYTGKDQFTFVLTAEDETNPMPEGSNGKTKTVTVTGTAAPDFGDITFDYPDAYYYTITRSPQKHEHITEGTESYRVMIAKFNDGKSVMVTWDKNGQKADEIKFIDTYRKPAPKTGEDDYLYVILIFAAAVLLMIGKEGKRCSKDSI